MVDSTHNYVVSSLKAAAWERAKGELRSIAALEGSKHDGERDEFGRYKYQRIEEAVNDFINDFEGEGHHE